MHKWTEVAAAQGLRSPGQRSARRSRPAVDRLPGKRASRREKPQRSVIPFARAAPCSKRKQGSGVSALRQPIGRDPI